MVEAAVHSTEVVLFFIILVVAQIMCGDLRRFEILCNGVARTLNCYAHQMETTGSSSDTLHLRPFSKWELLLKRGRILSFFRAVTYDMEITFTK